MALEFDDQYNEFKRPLSVQRQSRLVAFLIRHRLARDERDANKKALAVAVGIIILSLCMAVWAYTKGNTRQEIYNFPDELISRLPLELQTKILNVIYGAKK